MSESTVTIHGVTYPVLQVPAGDPGEIAIAISTGLDIHNRVADLVQKLYDEQAEVYRREMRKPPRSLVDVAMRVQRDHIDALRYDNIIIGRLDVSSRGTPNRVGSASEIAARVQQATNRAGIRHAVINALYDQD